MKHSFISVIFILSFLTACRSGSKQAIGEFTPNKRLSTSSLKLIYTVDSLEWLSKGQLSRICSKDLSSQIDTVIYLDGKIYISCLRVGTGCAEYVPDIQFVGDTLKLDMHLMSDEVCTEQNAWRVTYLIDNSSGKKYIVQKYL